MEIFKRTFIASASEIQSSALYMTIKATLFTSPRPNKNGVACTEGFIDSIVDNTEKYIGLPLCADVTNLANGQYDKLGHCYDQKTDTFSSSMIGSFYKFEKVTDENGECALIGYARVLKRFKKVCKAIGELFAEGSLKFSFEISCGSYEELEDKTIMIDASENNYLEGMAIVSMPACPDAVALELVAEINNIGKEADVMENEEIVAETEVSEEVQTETADVHVVTTHVEEDRVDAYDYESGKEIEVETTTVVREIDHIKDAVIAEESNDSDSEVSAEESSESETAACGNKKSEEKTASEETAAKEVKEEVPEEKPEEKEEDEEDEMAACKKKCAETEILVASLSEEIKKMVAEITELKSSIEKINSEKIVASEHIENTVNPFMASIDTNNGNNKKYRLLESNDSTDKKYTLL